MLCKKKYILIIALFCSLTSWATNNISFKKNYIGKLGSNLDISLHIKNNNGNITGFYYYHKVGVDIKIIGIIDNQSLSIYELDYKNDTIAMIKGLIRDSIVSGEWINLKTKKLYSISLTETNTEIVPLPQKIEGKYVSDICDLTLTIKKIEGIYYYSFISKLRTLKGEISFTRGIENYIILEDIEFAEDYFDVGLPEENELSLHYEKLKKEGKRRLGIDCFLDAEEIIIQNYGNAMNYYVKLNDCGEKYIHLIKQ